MNYQDYDYGTETDTTPWTSTPPPVSQAVAPRGDAQLYPISPNPVVIAQPQQPSMADMMVLGSMLRSLQQTQNQQMVWLRDFDARINRIEINTRPPVAVVTPSFERVTWWAIWGLLMLILGGALTIVIVLILLNVQFR